MCRVMHDSKSSQLISSFQQFEVH